jgi:hypothetical protein
VLWAAYRARRRLYVDIRGGRELSIRRGIPVEVPDDRLRWAKLDL